MSTLRNNQKVSARGNIREVVGATSDGRDFQEQILDHTGKLIATVHGATEQEAGENAEFIEMAINNLKSNYAATDAFLKRSGL